MDGDGLGVGAKEVYRREESRVLPPPRDLLSPLGMKQRGEATTSSKTWGWIWKGRGRGKNFS